METFRGGMLLLFRWLIHYPIVFGTYRVRNWSRAPFLMQRELRQGAPRPGILVSNYGNYFFDDMLGLMLGPVWPFTFARESLCRMAILSPLFRFFRTLPIARTTDPRYTLEERRARNEKAFARAAELLRKGHWLSVFPEVAPGASNGCLEGQRCLAVPIKPGVAIVALRAEDAAGWGLGLNLYVYGTAYENKLVGRSNLYIRWAPVIEVARYRDLYREDPAKAVDALLNDVEQSLRTAVSEAREEVSARGRRAIDKRVGDIGTRSERRESLVYRVLGFGLLAVGFVLSWPFRAFGRLCAADPSEEMTHQFVLWSLVLVTGVAVSEWRWAAFQVAGTWLASGIWLWAWRRGIVYS